MRRGEVNAVPARTSRTVGEIVRANVLTRFNALIGALGLLVILAGAPLDALFLGVLVINSGVGIVQELRAKRTLDQLAVLQRPAVTVRRDGRDAVVDVDDVVLDDLVVLAPGDQVPVDGQVRRAEAVEVDESLLTGESEPVLKQPGDEVRSGSFLVAGSALVQATAVGTAAYAHRLTEDARRFSLARSELMIGTNRLLRWISWLMLVIGPLLLWSELTNDQGWREAVTAAAAGLVGMVPEGLVLLTTLAFFVAVVTLARRHVLVQQLPAVEILARVDVVCLDKTGTITEGAVEVSEVLPVGSADPATVEHALAALAATGPANATAAALARRLPNPPPWTPGGTVPFSSARKWSGAEFGAQGTWVLGAPEIVLAACADGAEVRARADEIAAGGSRVVALATTGAGLDGEGLPGSLEPAALVRLDERIRPDAADTLAYFDSQGVLLKVISGDHPRTVAAVAAAAGLPGAADREPVDARELPADEGALAEALESSVVFGRVMPEQKRAMVRALRSRGHVVAMTGDGVNDALALKDADLGVAMGSGAPATRAVAELVLLDGRFAHLPVVVAEGRRVIANVERVARLFVSKNVMSVLVALAVVVASVTYPFRPRHLTVFSALTIGIPAFVLALAPNARRYVPGFLRRVVEFSLPVGATLAVAVVVVYGVAKADGGSVEEGRSAALVTAMIVGLAQLVMVSRPVRGWKLALVLAMGGAFVGLVAMPVTRDALELDLPAELAVIATLVGGAGAVVVVAIGLLVDRREERLLAGSG